MVLADTSVWIEHFRHHNAVLADYLSAGLVLMHPFVAGVLACGTLKDRAVILFYLAKLPAATQASNAEVLQLLEDRKLWGCGLGWIDAHILASALLSGSRLWTLDVRLAKAAAKIGLGKPR